MLEISDEINCHFSPAKPIKTFKNNSHTPDFNTNELLEISENISQYYAPTISPTINRLVLLPIDPDHLYAYWNFSIESGDSLMQNMSSNELSLRIYPQSDNHDIMVEETPICDIPVRNFHSRKKITLPREKNNARYFAHIGTHQSEDKFVSVIKSNQTFINHHVNTSKTLLNNATTNYHSVIQNETDKITAHESISVKSHYASSHHSGKGCKKQ